MVDKRQPIAARFCDLCSEVDVRQLIGQSPRWQEERDEILNEILFYFILFYLIRSSKMCIT